MDIKTARIICDLLELQNFSKVAQKHKLSQSAVSQRLTHIEMLYKCQMIDRKHHPLTLTAAGELFHKACKDIVCRYEKLINEIKILPTSPRQVNVASILSIGMHAFQPHIKKIMLCHPEIKLKVKYYESNQIYNRILSGQSDIGIVAVPQKKNKINVFSFEDELLVMACCTDHPLANKVSVDIQDLQEQEFVAFNKNIPTRKLVDGILKEYDVNVNVKKEFDNIETLKRAIELNGGISILPETAMAREVARGTLKAIAFSNERFVRPTGLLVKKTARIETSVQCCLDLLLNENESQPSHRKSKYERVLLK